MPTITINPTAEGRVQFDQEILDDQGDPIELLDIRLTALNGSPLSSGFQKPDWLNYTHSQATVDGKRVLTISFDLALSDVQFETSMVFSVSFRDQQHVFDATTSTFTLNIIPPA